MGLEQWEALSHIDPRVLTIINTLILGWVVYALRRLQNEFWKNSTEVKIASVTDRTDDKIRDDRVTSLAAQNGGNAAKLDALHRRLDEHQDQWIAFTTEMKLRMTAVERKLHLATGVE